MSREPHDQEIPAPDGEDAGHDQADGDQDRAAASGLLGAASIELGHAQRVAAMTLLTTLLFELVEVSVDHRLAIDPDVLAALGELGISGDPDLGDHVIMVGDRDHDVLGAKRHGIPCIGVTWGYGDPPELLGSGAVALADSPAEVVDLVHESYRLNHW